MRQSVEGRVYEGADIIDSRDVIARIEELEDEQDEDPDHFEYCEVHSDRAECVPSCEVRLTDEGEELIALKTLAEQAEGSPDWRHGETLIKDSYFEDYAEELAHDIGAIGREAREWPLSFIDWAAAAEALQQDYMSVTYGSTDYWIRG